MNKEENWQSFSVMTRLYKKYTNNFFIYKSKAYVSINQGLQQLTHGTPVAVGICRQEVSNFYFEHGMAWVSMLLKKAHL